MQNRLSNHEKTIDAFRKDVHDLFEGHIVSIILFGSGASSDYIPGKSDLNFLVVLSREGIRLIENAQSCLKKWMRQRIPIPLFMTPEYINASLDSFPIEFLDMQHQYLLIEGEDILKEIRIKKQDLRLQCERELKVKLLQLRQGLIETTGKMSPMRAMVSQFIIALVAIFKALLVLKDKEIPDTKQNIILNACREYDLDEGLFSVLLSVRGYETVPKKEQMITHIKKAIDEMEKLSSLIE